MKKQATIEINATTEPPTGSVLNFFTLILLGLLKEAKERRRVVDAVTIEVDHSFQKAFYDEALAAGFRVIDSISGPGTIDLQSPKGVRFGLYVKDRRFIRRYLTEKEAKLTAEEKAAKAFGAVDEKQAF